MKVGQEVNFLAGQIFMLGVAAVAVVPRVPSDTLSSRIGGRLSLPFRRALLLLAGIGLVRTLACHLVADLQSTSNNNNNDGITISPTLLLKIADATLGTIQVVGQNFLCLTTAYILQCQLETVIHIDGGGPGRSLMPYLTAIFILTVAGSLLSAFINPCWFFLVNMAEALSCRPVIKTLKTYAMITTKTSSDNQRNPYCRQPQGPILVQALLVVEYWFLTTALLSCVAEFVVIQSGDLLDDDHQHYPLGGLSFVLQLLLQAIRTNQDNGVDDWTRLLLHSVLLNSIDELEHFTGGLASASSATSANNNNSTTTSDKRRDTTATTTMVPALGLRQRG